MSLESCPACGHIAYVNPRLVVTTFPITDAGEIVRRAGTDRAAAEGSQRA